MYRRARFALSFFIFENSFYHITRLSLTRQSSRELIDRFFYTVSVSLSRLFSHPTSSSGSAAVLHLLRITGVRIIAYYRSFIGRHTIAIHSLCCLAL